MFRRLVYHIGMFLIACAFSLVFGDRCTMMQVHESSKASYIPGNSCIVHTDVEQIEFDSLLEWCSSLHAADKASISDE